VTDLTRRSLIAGGLALLPASTVPLRARSRVDSVASAASFGEAVGICIHPSWRNGIWSEAPWPQAFLDSGVRHARGKIAQGRAGREAVADLRPLFARGVKICATVASEGGAFDFEKTKDNLDFLAEYVGAENLSAIESANEYNKPSSRPSDWAPRLRQFQQWLYQEVRSNRALSGVPVVAPSIWGRLTGDYRELGNLEPYVDRGCLHYYTGGRRPTRAGRPSPIDEGGSLGQYALEDAIQDARTLAPSKPLWITEYGYRVEGPGSRGRGPDLPEAAAARYLIRGLLDAFEDGVEKIFIYSLLDDVHRDGKYHGLIDGSLRRRPTFDAVRNLMALFDDRKARGRPTMLPYSLAGAPPTLKRQLFMKNDGSYLLTLYQDVDSYDQRRRQLLQAPPAPVELRLPRPAARMDVYTPTIAAAAVQSVTGARTLAVPVADHVTVVRITPVR